MLGAALSYARRGVPVFPLHSIDGHGVCTCGGPEVNPKCTPGKHPRTRRGHLDATTDLSRIHAWFNRWRGANIGIPTGERSGILALDVDQPAGLEALEAEHAELPATRTHSTGSGGIHYLFTYAASENIRNSAGKLAEGLDVRGEGGYIIAPPSRTTRPYEVLNDLPLADIPACLMEKLRQPREIASSNVRSVTTAAGVSASGPAIPLGTRDDTLTRIAGRLHDGSRCLDDLAADLLEINARRCEPPLPDEQVLKVARSIHRREPCSSVRPREVEELVEALSEFWHGQSWEGLAGKSEARFARALIREGRRFGTKVPIGLRIEKSFRQIAEILGVHRNTVNNVVQRGKAAGWLRQDNAGRKGEESGAFVLVDPRQLCDTYSQGGGVGEGVTSLSRSLRQPLNVADLDTPHFRHRGPVGYSREHTLCALESHGPQSRESAAELLGWSRPRDLQRLNLEPLTELGLLVEEGGIYAVPADHRDRHDGVRREKYSTIQPRVRRERSVEGRWVHVVKDSGMVASESERARLDREKYGRERQAYREWQFGKRRVSAHWSNTPGADGHIEDLERVVDTLPEADCRTLKAIEAFERKYGRGSFRWDRASCKELFYSGPISGLWPDLEELARIRAYVEAAGGLRAAA